MYLIEKQYYVAIISALLYAFVFIGKLNAVGYSESKTKLSFCSMYTVKT